ncbi:hypothetical protein FGO68_gene5432 [Halteria grandinella]|uniref:Uncharacterized protein n=1 Tax=Halteria grandinella TaxID=5974 RepID=A0A8J8NCV8_HALGN|nr:hypothetical protein FGO68_gene5432 [Halteria grandinella]
MVGLLRDHRHGEGVDGVLPLRQGLLEVHLLVHHFFEDHHLLHRISLIDHCLGLFLTFHQNSLNYNYNSYEQRKVHNQSNSLHEFRPPSGKEGVFKVVLSLLLPNPLSNYSQIFTLLVLVFLLSALLFVASGVIAV